MQNLFKTIYGDKINLIKISLKYLDDFYEYGSDKKLYKYLHGINKFNSKKDAEIFLKKLIKRSEKKDAFWWLLYNKKLKKIIGSIGTHNIDYKNKSLEISYALSVNFQGQGFFSETISLIIRRFIEEFKFERIFAITEIKNSKSINGLKRNNFVEEGILRNNIIDKKGKKNDSVLLSFCRNYDLQKYLNDKKKINILNKNHLKNYSLRSIIKFPPEISETDLKLFFYNLDLKFVVKESFGYKQSVNELILKKPYIPVLKDLYRLYKFIELNKRINILEFGSGWSSLMFCISLNLNKNKFSKDINHLRKNNPFEILILDNQKKFLNISKRRVNQYIKNSQKNVKINWHFSKASITKFNDRYATKFDDMPLFNPDFIYLDGPDQFKIFSKEHNFNTNHPDFMPMSCDILQIEQFLVPGTIIVVDGRAANALFLKNNFQRNWLYEFDEPYDQHIFYLNDHSLGQYNSSQLEFYKK